MGKQQPGVGVEPGEFTSPGGGGKPSPASPDGPKRFLARLSQCCWLNRFTTGQSGCQRGKGAVQSSGFRVQRQSTSIMSRFNHFIGAKKKGASAP